MIDTIWQTLAQTPGYLFDPNKRIFIGYIVMAFFLALCVYGMRKSKKSAHGFFRFLFAKKIWWAPSARQDYQLWLYNRILKALLFGPIVLTMVPIALATTELIESVFGAPSPWQLSNWSVVVIFTLLLFIADDFSRFLLHYALHKVPFLWHYHKVHHSAKVLTPFTIYRSHPFESYLYACRMALAQGIVVGLCFYLFGTQLSMFDVLGANVFVFAFNAMGSNLRHSHVWLSWGRRTENWFISPAQHQIHHSDNPKHFDTNLGSALAIWDKLFGTLIRADQVGKITIGVGNYDAGHHSIWAIYTKPIIDSFKSVIPKRIRLAKKSTEISNKTV
ncbi:sterol desaturase family protein [Pseudoalteromonas shioyasakiensis]|uniref:sterol desaturase family protein n=1 Tax=Pseudoalteromonas shioyasakiensis TaxID=1190813 RepID=UPI002118D47C|nr:sterol desaturase family protein [Pseudoalteromonas shioyasakiensis]MCQ8876930.1 sterol desaturase family protein [Pseudoalteromonas shioyasakiensis]